MTGNTTQPNARKMLVLQPRRFHLGLPLLSLLVIVWMFSIPMLQANGADFPIVILLGATTLALLGFGVGYLQRVVLYLDDAGNELVWEADTLIGTSRRTFKITDIAEFGMHRTRVRSGYAVKPAIIFKNKAQSPFPLLTVSISGERMADMRQTLHEWSGIEYPDQDMEIPEDQA